MQTSDEVRCLGSCKTHSSDHIHEIIVGQRLIGWHSAGSPYHPSWVSASTAAAHGSQRLQQPDFCYHALVMTMRTNEKHRICKLSHAATSHKGAHAWTRCSIAYKTTETTEGALQIKWLNFACQAICDVTCAQTQFHLLYSICDEKQFCRPCSSNRWHAIGMMQLLLVVRWYQYHQIQSQLCRISCSLYRYEHPTATTSGDAL